MLAMLAGPMSLAGLGLTAANAADGDYCFIEETLQPGRELTGDCLPSPHPDGYDCGNGLFFNNTANQCVADNATCDSGAGSYQQGVCTANPTPPTPAEPTTPANFTIDPNGGSAPAGEQQPMCVNASPFIGGGMFVVSGTVLCYTGAGRGTNIYAYTDDGANSGGWDPFNQTSWDSLSLKDLYASDDVTALGTLTAFGGAQLYSPDGHSGMQINDDGVLIGSSDDNGNVSTINTTAESVALSSTDGSATSSLTVSGGDGIEMVAGNVADGDPAVRISGGIAETSDAQIGVLIQGDGQGNQPTPETAPANWADVLIASKSYDGAGNGSGIIVNDYGVIVRSAATGNSYNAFGAAGNEGTTVINEIGGTGNGGASINRIGNTNAATSFIATAGTSRTMVIQGALDASTGQGASTVGSGAVSGGTNTAMLGTEAPHTVVNANGAISVVEGVADEASSGLYIVNGNGQTNGVAVNERQAVLSGGETSPTTMTLSDTGAHFSNSSTGAPVIVSGVADGQGAMDAVNKRQLDSGIASVAALAGLPAPQQGKSNSIGIAMGRHNSGTAVALGGQSLLGDTLSVKYGASLSYASGHMDTTASVGMGLSW